MWVCATRSNRVHDRHRSGIDRGDHSLTARCISVVEVRGHDECERVRYNDDVVGELGDLHLEIALLGDAINTTARIEDMCRQCEHHVMASYTLIERIEMPEGVTAQLFGSICLKGKSETLRLYGLERDLRARPVMRQSIRERFSLP